MAKDSRLGSPVNGFWFWVALLGALNLACLGITLLAPDRGFRSLISDCAGVLIPILAATCCFVSYRKRQNQGLSIIRYLPLIMGLAALVYGLGDLFYVYETRFLHKPSNPGYADIWYLMQYPLFIAAVAIWPSKPLPAMMRWRTWSDGLVTATCLFAFAWVYLIGPQVKGSTAPTLGIAVGTAYPILDTLILFSLYQMMRKGFDPRFRVAAYLFMVGLMVTILGDVSYALALMDQSYHSGGWLDVTWLVTCSLAGLAGLLVKERIHTPGFREANSDREILVAQRQWTLYAPYVFVPATALLGFHVFRASHEPIIRNGLMICIGILVVAILIRQMLAIGENGSLYGRLRDAYAELEVRNEQASVTASEAERINEQLRKMATILEDQNRTLAKSNEVLEQLATRDGMTGLANHRAFQERLREEVAQAYRHSHALSLALVDVDFFKQYNDNYGHPAGDEVLKSIAKLLQEATRHGDLAARYGGEEFALLMPYTSRSEAFAILERIREIVATFPFKHRRVTLSIGLCMLDQDCLAPEAMIDQADRALYAAKSRGRNQVVVASDLRTTSLKPGESKNVVFDASTPMGYGAILAAGINYNPQALAHEPQCAVIAGLLATLELKDPMTRGSALRVMWYAMRLAQECRDRGATDITPTATRALGFGALLHDVGRLGIPDHILTTSEIYSAEMRSEIEKHPSIGADLVRKFPGLSAALPAILHHHERWDGTGYPQGLSGTNIPKSARILNYVDAFNAMSTDRPYAAAKSYEEICDEIKANVGKQFDPDLFEAFMAIPKSDWDDLRNQDPFGLGHQTRAA